jgi:hypothetical protein
MNTADAAYDDIAYQQWLAGHTDDRQRPTTSIACEPLEIPPRMLQRLQALEAGHWATEGIRGAVYRFGCRRNDGLSASRIVHTDTAVGSIET